MAGAGGAKRKASKPRALRLAKKPHKVTQSEVMRRRGESKEKRTYGITAVLEEGPVRSPPIQRSDMYHGQQTWRLPFHLRFLTYKLDRVVDGTHFYRWDGVDE